MSLVRDWCEDFQNKSISLEGTTGLNRRFWQAAILLLLGVQLVLALLTTAASVLEQGWQVRRISCPELLQPAGRQLLSRSQEQELASVKIK